MRRRRAALLAATAALVVAVAVPAAGAGRSVRLGDNFFTPRSLTVSANTTVTWTWRTQAPHNVVGSGPARFSSGGPETSGRYRRRLTRRGTYRIVCALHPDMRMTLRVR